MCCGIWPKAECIPADRHSHKTCSVRGLLCRLPCSESEPSTGEVACRPSSLPFRISAHPFRHAKTASPFPSQWHTHTRTPCLSCLVKATWIFPCARLAQVKAALVFSANRRIPLPDSPLPLRATQACLSVSYIPVYQGWAWQREQAAEHM